MNKRTALVLAYTLAAVITLGTIVDLTLALRKPGILGDPHALANQLLTGLYTLVFGIVGVLILARQLRNTVGWLLVAVGVSLSLGGGIQDYLEQSMTLAPSPNLAAYLFVWLNGWSWWLLIGPLLLLLLVFPTGHFLSPRWRWVGVMILALFVTFLYVATTSPVWQDPNSGTTFPGPFAGAPASIPFEEIQVPWIIALLTTAVLAAASVFIRYRRSGPIEREQLKWFLYACSIFLVLYVVEGLSQETGTQNFYDIVFAFAILLFPVAIGIAILRYRLYDIDVIIRRTLIYGVLTVMLAIIYFTSVVILQQGLRAFTGQTSDLAIVASTLIIAALFAPLRSGSQRLIDRRLYRRRYDAALVLANFGTTVRDEVDLDRLKGELLTVVEETMQPVHANLWMRKAERK